MDVVVAVAWLAIGFGVSALIAFILTRKPELIVSFYARQYRGLTTSLLHLSDAQIKSISSRSILGLPMSSFKQFIERGAEHPKEFPKAIEYVRNMGNVIWAIIIPLAALLIFATIFGRVRIDP